MHEDSEVSFSRFEADERRIWRTVAASELSLSAIQQRSMSTVESLVLAQRDDENRLEALNRESTLFLSAHRRNEQRYKPLFDSLQRVGQSEAQRSVVYELLFTSGTKAKSAAALNDELTAKKFAESDTKTTQRRIFHGAVVGGTPVNDTAPIPTPARKYVPSSVLRVLRSKSPSMSGVSTPRR